MTYRRSPKDMAISQMLPNLDSMNVIPQAWDALSKVPGGTKLFSKAAGRLAPYSGSINAHIVELHKGYGRNIMHDAPSVRNHLKSVHAIALANLAEMTSGVTMLYSIRSDQRAILTGLNMEFLKKARGTLTAICEFEPPAYSDERVEFLIEPKIFNEAGELVAKGEARWLVGPARK